MNQKPAIHFFFEIKNISLRERNRLKQFILSIFKAEKKKCVGLTYIFCSDKRLLEINRQFLDHDFYTDIITFDLSDKKGELIGEVYISTDRVRDNAKTFGEKFNAELHRVIFHGALHLCGYRDKTAKEKSQMTAKEEFYLKKYGIRRFT